MRILFMGTPDFAAKSLARLIANGADICGAVCQCDKPKGRGMDICMPPVKQIALQSGIPVFQPDTLKNEAFIQQLSELDPELIVVVAYGRILPKYILDYPKCGCINVHASLLPKYRGAAPIQWAVINGERQTGVCTIYLTEQLDAGDILLSQSTNIGIEETAGALYERLSEMGASLLIDTVEGIKAGSLTPTVQEESQVSFAPMLKKEMGEINWNSSAEQIYHLVLGLSPWPGAYTYCDKGILKIHKLARMKDDFDGQPGSIVDVDGRIIVKTGNGCVELMQLQLPGKRQMSAPEFLRGNTLYQGAVLGG